MPPSALAFLSDLEVYLFLTAAQGDVRNNILQAPKVTTFNGAPATIFNNQSPYYVASLIPIVGPGSVAFFPQVTQFPNGVTLFVTPVVSADRRYVRMTLSPVLHRPGRLRHRSRSPRRSAVAASAADRRRSTPRSSSRGSARPPS